jgi:hypothetical protein
LRVRWRNRDEGLVKGEPSTAGRARNERRSGESQSAEARSTPTAEPAHEDETPSERELGLSQPAAQAVSTPGDIANGPQKALVLSPEATEARLAGPIEAQLDRLARQIQGLQEQLDPLIARRNEAIARRASRHVASIVAAAEKSAAGIRAGAEKDAAAIRERLLAAVQADVERIRAEAQADAAWIRREGYSQAVRARERMIAEARAEVQAACSRLSTQLQVVARDAIAGIAPTTRTESALRQTPSGGMPSPSGTPIAGEGPADPAPASPQQTAPGLPVPGRSQRITDELVDAVGELQKAAEGLERSLHDLPACGGVRQRVDPG